MQKFWNLLLCCALLPLIATAQNSSQVARPSSSPWRYPYTFQGDKTKAIAAPIEIFVGYSYLRGNQSPGQCGCFNMNGGSTEVAFHTYRWFSTVADLTGERTGRVNGGPQGLSLASFTVGTDSPIRSIIVTRRLCNRFSVRCMVSIATSQSLLARLAQPTAWPCLPAVDWIYG